jgi:rubredoxin
MKLQRIQINFRGGIISPGELLEILEVSQTAGVRQVSFGSRQQLIILVAKDAISPVRERLEALRVPFETGRDPRPNVISSYPASEIFIHSGWVKEGLYKDIFDEMDFTPKLKINISEGNQSFTPLLTGNINWVASQDQPHFWHVFVRFPRTNTVYEWDQLVYSHDIAACSRALETAILEQPDQFYDNERASGPELFSLIDTSGFILQARKTPALLPAFNLPYYEGLNRYNGQYWIGIYRRDEKFSIAFLRDICRLCLDTAVGQLCSTPWKSLIVKGISEKDRPRWNHLLARHKVNVRHAANELNFQVEDDCPEGLALKNFLVRHLSRDDIRTFGLCIGIKTRRKSEVFSSILVREKPILRLGRWSLGRQYDVLCAKDFNPNERTGSIFSRNNLRWSLAEQVKKAVISFYNHQDRHHLSGAVQPLPEDLQQEHPVPGTVFRCSQCLTHYDEMAGEPQRDIGPGTLFSDLPIGYTCPVCESGKENYLALDTAERNSLAVGSSM